MAPRYPFARNQPSSSSTPSSERPIVVSASGRAPASPANLTADSPSTLRSRITSPRNPDGSGVPETFQNNAQHYPSPSARLGLGKGKKKKDKDGGTWSQLGTSSPVSSIPKYDSRGYPTRDRPPDGSGFSPESLKSTSSKYNGAIKPSSSSTSLSSVSTTGAGVGDENGRFLSPERPTSYYIPPAASDSSTPASLYPPTINYSLSCASYHPYDNPNGLMPRDGPSPIPSLYGDSRVSLERSQSAHSGNSMTQFRKYDSLDVNHSGFSISSKGGRKHLADMFSLPADPSSWSYLGPEADDDFHDPDIKPSRQTHFFGAMMTVRGAGNIGCLIILVVILITLFAIYPILSQVLTKTQSTLGAYNIGGINATGQIPSIGPFQLIDKDTPTSAYTYKNLETGTEWELVFSDEFNNDGRTFYDGDDPYWQAEDLHYWQTNNLEWYDPKQIITKNGALQITLNDEPSHGRNYTGGMMTTWNRFCYTGGYVEASVSLPGTSTVYGLWPAIWAMGNLGRAGYGGTLDGMWPYSYDSCDVGTLANQTLNNKPEIAMTSGPDAYNNELSYLPGQRLSRCTCTSDTTHPGPKLSNGTFVGRGAPEIDMFEALVDTGTLIGQVSQSGQWAPFNPYYNFINNSATYSIADDTVTALNGYLGGVYQQATSAVSNTNQNCYTGGTGCFSVYGFEYAPGPTGYITWVNNGKKAWTVRGGAMAPNSAAQVGQRLVSQEPMYLIVNLGISENFGAIDYAGLLPLWPVTMEVDYIRVYQDPNNVNIGCDPANMPTAKYIAAYPDAYANPNITTFDQIPNSVRPKNSLIDTC